VLISSASVRLRRCAWRLPRKLIGCRDPL
jgi:hypothetical protein